YQLAGVRTQRRPIAPHVERPAQTLDEIDRRIPLGRTVVARREIHVHRPSRRIAERVARQQLAVQPSFLDATDQLPTPRFHPSDGTAGQRGVQRGRSLVYLWYGSGDDDE